jgi:cobaltochelatase CobS
MYQAFNIQDTFAIELAPGKERLAIEGFADATHPCIPRRQPHTFDKETLNPLLVFLARNDGEGLYLTGPTGAGKTSLVNQVAARLHWPVQALTCHGRLELAALVGQFVLVNGATQFIHGPLSVAARDGHLLLLNELDLMDASELAGLNDIIEGQPLVIPEHGGEVIRPHPKFRVIATGNSAGAGDSSGLYRGVLRQNLAFMDRFQVLQVGYLDALVETEVLAAAVPSMSRDIIEKMIQLAHDVRRGFMGQGEEQIADLTVTMSTRTVIRWARLAQAFKAHERVFSMTLDLALTARAQPEEREAIHRLAKDAFGEELWR